jgi:DivIVA domain-containing protein
MGQLLLFIVVALVVAAIVFGVTVMVSGGDSGLTPVEPDGRAVPLPGDRPLGEDDILHTRFDTALRGYRMAQVDQALQRAAYDIGYKGELISVLEAEVAALREGRTADADVLRRAREAAVAPPPPPAAAADEPVQKPDMLEHPVPPTADDAAAAAAKDDTAPAERR